MAFTIKNIVGASLELVGKNLAGALDVSRFVSRIEEHKNKITVHDVRLKQKKLYCGSHPFKCPLRHEPGLRNHRKTKFLEGADWVAFNDLINDVLDNLGVSADVASSLVVIRKGTYRCIKYDGHKTEGFSEWNKFGEYKNCIGKIVKSKFPVGTPGIVEYK